MALKHKRSVSSGTQPKKASCPSLRGECGWVGQVWVSKALPSQGRAKGHFWPFTMFTCKVTSDQALPATCGAPVSLCHPFLSHQMSKIMGSKSQCSPVLELCRHSWNFLTGNKVLIH